MTEFEKMIRLLDTSWCMRSQIVPCLVGPPGIGKTAAVKQHAINHNAKVVKIVASRCVPSETVGMTMPDHKNHSMTIYNSMQLGSLRDGDILFLDELLEADQFVLSTLLTVIESREMADGTPLPDIQIIAATNDTIPPEQLKGNIRQRFMFQRFRVDCQQTRDYILDKTGLVLTDTIMRVLTDDGTDYNFLTPRSLTKLCMWIDKTPREKLDDTARVINLLWNSNLGDELACMRIERDSKMDTPEKQFRNTIMNMKEVEDINIDFNECSFSEMLDILQSMPEWDVIAEKLSEIEVKGEEKVSNDIEF